MGPMGPDGEVVMRIRVGLFLGLAAAAGLTTWPVSAAKQEDIGRQMEREYGVVRRSDSSDGRLVDQLDRVVDRILEGVNDRRTRAEAFSLKSAKLLGGRDDKHDQVVNAFALPDGRIYVTLGLARAVQESRRADDELAFVVGHEVTHVVEKHSVSRQNEMIKAGLLSVLIGAVTKSRTATTVAGGVGAAYVSSFSRKDEYSADRGGLVAMYRARYDTSAAISMLKRLKSKGESQSKTINGWFGSHPLTENRIERIRGMIEDLRAGRDIGDKSSKELEREDKARKGKKP